MALADTQLYQLGGFDPYTTMVQAPMQRKQAEMQAMETEQAYKEMQAEQAQKALPQMAGVAGQAPLAKMTSSVLPPDKYSVTDSSGGLTLAGEADPFALKATQEKKNMDDAIKRAKRARLMGDAKAEEGAMNEVRRADGAMTQAQSKVNEFVQQGQDSLVYNASLAKSQQDYDNKIKAAMDRAGLKQRPTWLPEKWNPDLSDELLPRASTKMAETIQKRKDAIVDQANQIRAADNANTKFAALLQAGFGGVKSQMIEMRQETVLNNAVEFVKTMGNIRDLPVSTSGIFGTKRYGTIFTGPLEAAANQLTPTDAQMLNNETSGLGRHLSWMVSGGLSPSVDVQNAFEKILKVETGDSPAAILGKFARARQEAENIMKTKQKSRLISPEFKQTYADLTKELELTVPFTVSDVNKWKNSKDKKKTFSQFMGETVLKPKEEKSAQSVKVGEQTYSRPAGMSDQDWTDYKKAVGAKE